MSERDFTGTLEKFEIVKVLGVDRVILSIKLRNCVPIALDVGCSHCVFVIARVHRNADKITQIRQVIRMDIQPALASNLRTGRGTYPVDSLNNGITHKAFGFLHPKSQAVMFLNSDKGFHRVLVTMVYR